MTKTKRNLMLMAIILTGIMCMALLMLGCQKAEKSSYSKSNFSATDTCVMEIKGYGTVEIDLDANQAPKTVEHFKNLVNKGFYNGLTFHRIIKDFMAQGGDPKGDGTGGSGENVVGEFQSNGVKNSLANVRGAVSMARSSDNNSGDSQFFIVHQTSNNNSSSLDGKYACFGYVKNGMEVIDKMINDAKPTDNNGTIAKDKQPVITSIKMTWSK